MNLFTTLKSIIAAFIGVQSDKNRQRDFEEGKLIQFIIIGFLAVCLFIGALLGVVSLVLQT